MIKLTWRDWLPFRRWRIAGTADYPDETPEKLPKRVIVLVGSPENPKWAVFKCPCNKGHIVMLNLDESRSPYWRMDKSQKGKIGFRPSIDYLDGARRCHFFLRDGKISWAKDSRI